MYVCVLGTKMTEMGHSGRIIFVLAWEEIMLGMNMRLLEDELIFILSSFRHNLFMLYL